jgi:hypothetical protein
MYWRQGEYALWLESSGTGALHKSSSSACMELPQSARTYVRMRNSRTARRLYIKFDFREIHEDL